MKPHPVGLLPRAFGSESGVQRRRRSELTSTRAEPTTGRSTVAASSLEVLGRMASELAHELNNQLATALNYTAIVHRRLGVEHPATEHLGELRNSLQRATALAATLKLVGRRNAEAPELLDLDEVLLTLSPVLRHLVTDCAIELPAEPLGRIRAQRSDVERLIVAIALYAHGKRSSEQQLVLSYAPVGAPHATRAPYLRVCCTLDGEPLLDGSGKLRGKLVEGASLRHALKRCGARIGHDRIHTWVDFPRADG